MIAMLGRDNESWNVETSCGVQQVGRMIGTLTRCSVITQRIGTGFLALPDLCWVGASAEQWS